jgi:DNA polymerase-1
VDWVKSEAKHKGYLIGLDGRKLPVRSDHMALNTLLQSAGAVVMKQALYLFYQQAEQRYGPHGGRWALMLNVHDEVQAECEPEIAEQLGQLFADSITQAGEYFELRIRLDGEYKVGDSWASTH